MFLLRLPPPTLGRYRPCDRWVKSCLGVGYVTAGMGLMFGGLAIFDKAAVTCAIRVGVLIP